MREKLFHDIRNILINDWDPIMIGDNKKLSDEYDSYAYEIQNLLLSYDIDKEKLYQLLLYHEENTIGMSISNESRMLVVEKLLSLVSGDR